LSKLPSDVLIIVRSHNILVASWWWSREGYKPRRWEVSIRFPDDLIKQYCKLAEGEQERLAENVRGTVAHFVSNLDIIDNNALPARSNRYGEGQSAVWGQGHPKLR
jgi:hypothetical protein